MEPSPNPLAMQRLSRWMVECPNCHAPYPALLFQKVAVASMLGMWVVAGFMFYAGQLLAAGILVVVGIFDYFVMQRVAKRCPRCGTTRSAETGIINDNQPIEPR